MTAEIPLGNDFVLKVTFGPNQKENLVELWNPSGNLADEQVFSEDFWRRQRKKKTFKKWLSDNLEGAGYGKLSDEGFKDVKLEISRAYRDADTSEMPAEDEFEEEEFDENTVERANRIVESGDVIPYLVKIMGIAGHKRDYARKILMACSSLSKKVTQRPISDYAIGETGKGKSHLMRVAFECIPNEYKINRGSISPLYLYYMTDKFGEDCLSGRVLFYDDVSLNPEKEMTIKAVTDPDFNDEVTHGTVQNQKALDLNIEGLPTVWISSVDMVENEQIIDRFFIDQPEETDFLDREVARHQKYHGRRGTLEPEAETNYSVAKAVWKKVAEETESLNVLIPFDYEWTAESSRRLQPFFLTMLYVVAKTNYKQRLIVGDALFATPEDFYVAKFVFNSFLRTTASQMTDRQFEVFKRVPYNKSNSKTRSDLVEETDVPYGKVRYDLGQLAESGFVNAEKESGTWHYWRTGKGVVESCGKLEEEALAPDELLKEFKEVFTDCEKKGLTPQIEDREKLDMTLKNKSLTVNPNMETIFGEYLETFYECPVLEKISQLSENVLDNCKNLFEIPKDSKLGSQLATISKEKKEESEASEEGDLDALELLGEESDEDATEALADWGMCDECGLKEAEYKHPEEGRKLCENCWREMGFG